MTDEKQLFDSIVSNFGKLHHNYVTKKGCSDEAFVKEFEAIVVLCADLLTENQKLHLMADGALQSEEINALHNLVFEISNEKYALETKLRAAMMKIKNLEDALQSKDFPNSQNEETVRKLESVKPRRGNRNIFSGFKAATSPKKKNKVEPLASIEISRPQTRLLRSATKADAIKKAPSANLVTKWTTKDRGTTEPEPLEILLKEGNKTGSNLRNAKTAKKSAPNKR